MDIPPSLLLPFFQVTQGSVHLASGSGQIIAADPSRIYLAVILQGSITGNIQPEGFPVGGLGFKIFSTTNYIDFTFKDQPGLVGLAWFASISAPSDVLTISIAYKPEY